VGSVTVLLVVIAVILVCWLLMAAASVWALSRRNRVVPGARTGAPLHWVGAPSRAASAHRRLRRAVGGARAALGGMPADAAVRGDVASCVSLLERQAIDVDHRLVVAARCPAATRWRLVNDLEPQVREVERIGSQLAEVAVMASPRPASAGDELNALNTRLRVLADARAELDAMEDGPRSAAAPAPPASAAPAAPPGALPPGEAAIPWPQPRSEAQDPVGRRTARPGA